MVNTKYSNFNANGRICTDSTSVYKKSNLFEISNFNLEIKRH